MDTAPSLPTVKDKPDVMPEKDVGILKYIMERVQRIGLSEQQARLGRRVMVTRKSPPKHSIINIPSYRAQAPVPLNKRLNVRFESDATVAKTISIEFRCKKRGRHYSLFVYNFAVMLYERIESFFAECCDWIYLFKIHLLSSHPDLRPCIEIIWTPTGVKRQDVGFSKLHHRLRYMEKIKFQDSVPVHDLRIQFDKISHETPSMLDLEDSDDESEFDTSSKQRVIISEQRKRDNVSTTTDNDEESPDATTSWLGIPNILPWLGMTGTTTTERETSKAHDQIATAGTQLATGADDEDEDDRPVEDTQQADMKTAPGQAKQTMDDADRFIMLDLQRIFYHILGWNSVENASSTLSFALHTELLRGLRYYSMYCSGIQSIELDHVRLIPSVCPNRIAAVYVRVVPARCICVQWLSASAPCQYIWRLAGLYKTKIGWKKEPVSLPPDPASMRTIDIGRIKNGELPLEETPVPTTAVVNPRKTTKRKTAASATVVAVSRPAVANETQRTLTPGRRKMARTNTTSAPPLPPPPVLQAHRHGATSIGIPHEVK